MGGVGADRIQGVGEGGRSPPTELGRRNSVVVEGKCCTRRPMSLRRLRSGSRSSPFQWKVGGPVEGVVIAAHLQSWGPRCQEVPLLQSQEPDPRGRVGVVVAGSLVEEVGEGESPVVEVRLAALPPTRSLLPHQE